MGLTSFGQFQDLRNRKGYSPHRTKFRVQNVAEHIVRFNARVSVAQKYCSAGFDGLGDGTSTGYSAMIQVVLTHSALERFAELHGMKPNKVDSWTPKLKAYKPQETVKRFFKIDDKGKLVEALCKHLDKTQAGEPAYIERGLLECKQGRSFNIAYISAAIRHIFVHGHLAANANRARPEKVAEGCMLISDFLLDFMDAEFTKSINELEKRIDAKEAIST